MDQDRDGVEFTIETFIKSRTKSCMRDAIAEERGLSVNRGRLLQKINRIKGELSQELKINGDHISADMIYERMPGNVSKQMIRELLYLERGSLSLSEMEESGEQFGDQNMNVGEVFEKELDEDTKQLLDEATARFSKLDVYILMKEFGLLGEDIRKQEMCEFVKSALFRQLLDADLSVRSKNDPVRIAYNKTVKIKKTLASLNGKIELVDLVGSLPGYFQRRWDEIMEEITCQGGRQ
jgi:hypothetical protein